MKKIIALFFFVMFAITLSTAQQTAIAQAFLQERGEVYFQFENPGAKTLIALSEIISLDQVNKSEVTAYANQKEFDAFLGFNLVFEVLIPPSLMYPATMLDNINLKSIQDWDFYPTYQAYLDMMYQFEADYPDLVEIISIGQSMQGRELLFARISDNVGVDEGEPQFLYVSSIHGDELVGYVLTLRLIDYLLSNYGTDPKVDNLVNNLDIWINPLANPDGTFHGGNNTVNGAIRYNANGVDLNRNYPDPEDGPHPDGNAWQIENINFMQLAEDNHFAVSANYHGGEEVCNYPWDTWSGLHPDDDWWQYVCHEYADTAQLYSPPGYLTGFDDGITNGYAWYTISGGRQDYMNFFHQCREFTMEVSSVKLPSASQLPTFWESNYRSMLNYMEQTLFGVSGTVTDASTGDPLYAEVRIYGHDADSSWVYSSATTGKYFRLINEGTYDITFSADGYFPQTIANVVVENRELTSLDVQLSSGELIVDFTASDTQIPIGSSIDFNDQTFGSPVSWEWSFEGGNPATSTDQNPSGIFYAEEGSFDVSLTVSDGTNTLTVTKENYINVSAEFNMTSTTVTTCTGLFYDSGGENNNYSDNEDFTMTFLPGEANGKVKIEFLSFSVEYQNNCNYDYLEIYDGNSASASLIGQYCGTNSPGTVEATNEEGALTFVFHSDGSVTEPGWTANVSCELELLPPVADFIADQTTITEGDTIYFSDLSLNTPTGWEWTFSGGTPQTSTEQNPMVIYDSPGTYGVMLIASNDAGSNTMIKNDYIIVEVATGIKNPISQNVKLYPNPANNQLNFENISGFETITISNVMGQMVLYAEINNNSQTIDISGLELGTYFVKIQSEDRVVLRKVLVNR
ncbi:MAG: PKD domain-containing protein [Bacteroidales bacterium]|nr:PKD domain-containing protein [Bacteroidales bacterium]